MNYKEKKFKQNLPVFLYDDNGEIRIGRYGDTVVTDEWHEFLKQYAQRVSREKCESCVFSYHDKAKGHHEVEDFYKEKPGDDDGQTFSPAI